MDEPSLLNNRYQLLEQIGKGGMAVVYRGRDLMLERQVAIKVLREDYSRSVTFQERFRQEARAAANLSHPNVVTVHDFGFDRGRLFLVMEYVPGMDLKSLLRQRGRLPLSEALPLMIQACAGIGYAHRAGLVHCDVKPHNMLVTPDQRLKVTDFGIARALATIEPEEHSAVVWGSPQYFSPEQAAGGAPSPASDVYSLGVVFYEMLTGSLPFQAPTVAELARLHMEAPPTPPSEYLPDLPPTVEQIILKVLSKEPAARYRTADQFARVLSTFLQNHAVIPAPVHTAPSEAETQPQLISVQPASSSPLSQPSQASDDTTLSIDWLTIFLALLAILAVGGLIPFWLYIWFSFNPPI